MLNPPAFTPTLKLSLSLCLSLSPLPSLYLSLHLLSLHLLPLCITLTLTQQHCPMHHSHSHSTSLHNASLSLSLNSTAQCITLTLTQQHCPMHHSALPIHSSAVPRKNFLSYLTFSISFYTVLHCNIALLFSSFFRKYFCGSAAQLSEGQSKTQRKGPRMWVGASAGA